MRLVITAGLEPATSSLEGWCTIQLCYVTKLLQPRIELGFSAHKTDTLTDCVIGVSMGNSSHSYKLFFL